MIAMTYTIELDIELSYLLQTALPQLVPIARRNSSLWAVQAFVRPLPAAH
jgi:hypothetical protein